MKNNGLFYRILLKKIQHPELFHPDRKFYKKTGIRQRRYGLLYRNEKQPTKEELQSFCDYIGVTSTELFSARQLEIEYKEKPQLKQS